MLLIVVGVVFLVRRRFVGGFCLFLIGNFAMVPRIAKIYGYDCIPDDFVAKFWPLLLVAIGIFLVIAHLLKFDRCKIRNRQFHRWRYHHRVNLYEETSAKAKEEELSDKFLKMNVFSYGKYYVIDTVFTGGVVKAVFGGMELDLRRAIFAEGETVLLIEAVFSGITILLPDDLCVDSKMSIVAGGLDDDRRINNQSSSKKIILEGSAVFSGIELI
jgi:predicted membrane protein